MKPFLIYLLLLAFFTASPFLNAAANDRLWYDAPASDFKSALPLGNGHLLAFEQGGTASEQFQLNEGSLWAAMVKDSPRNNPKLNLPYQTLGNLKLTFKGHEVFTKYSRDLDLKTGVSTVLYTVKGVVYKRESFASFSDSVVVIRLSSSKPASLNLTMTLTSDLPKCSIRGVDGMLVLSGALPSFGGGNCLYQTQVKPFIKNGRCVLKGAVYSVYAADEIVLYCSMASNFTQNENAVNKCTRILNRAFGKEFLALKENHLKTYAPTLLQSVLRLDESSQAQKNTAQRLREFKGANDVSLALLYRNYGRYLQYATSNPFLQARPEDAYLNLADSVRAHYNGRGDAAWLKSNFEEIKHTAETVLKEMPVVNASDLHRAMMRYRFFSTVCYVSSIQNSGLKGLLNADKALVDSVNAVRALLPALLVDSKGLLSLEAAQSPWSPNLPQPGGSADAQLQSNALYGLYPDVRISPYSTPDLAQAAQNTLLQTDAQSMLMTQNNGMCLWARLLDGNEALNVLQSSFSLYDPKTKKGAMLPNLLTSTANSMVEACINSVDGINEMLLQSHDGFMNVLPALPTQWANGSVSGLRTYGGFIVDLMWKNGALETMKITSTLAGNCRIRTTENLVGKNLKIAKNSNPNPFFRTLESDQIKESMPADDVKFKLPNTQLYDLKMGVGESVTLTRK